MNMNELNRLIDNGTVDMVTVGTASTGQRYVALWRRKQVARGHGHTVEEAMHDALSQLPRLPGLVTR